MNINKLAQQVHAQTKAMGWWDGDVYVCIYTKLQMISTEIAEATEGERQNLMDNHLPHRKMGEVELADALMRTLDLGEHLELKYEYPDAFEMADHLAITHKHLNINHEIIKLYMHLPHISEVTHLYYSGLVDAIITTANQQGYHIFAALQEKLEYNKTRADHQPQNRAKANGKKF